MQEKITSANDG